MVKEPALPSGLCSITYSVTSACWGCSACASQVMSTVLRPVASTTRPATALGRGIGVSGALYELGPVAPLLGTTDLVHRSHPVLPGGSGNQTLSWMYSVAALPLASVIRLPPSLFLMCVQVLAPSSRYWM